jgi:hypothetical protein
LDKWPGTFSLKLYPKNLEGEGGGGKKKKKLSITGGVGKKEKTKYHMLSPRQNTVALAK